MCGGHHKRGVRGFQRLECEEVMTGFGNNAISAGANHDSRHEPLPRCMRIHIATLTRKTGDAGVIQVRGDHPAEIVKLLFACRQLRHSLLGQQLFPSHVDRQSERFLAFSKRTTENDSGRGDSFAANSLTRISRSNVELAPKPFLQWTKRQRHFAARRITNEDEINVALRPLPTLSDRAVDEPRIIVRASGVQWPHVEEDLCKIPECLGQNVRKFGQNSDRNGSARYNRHDFPASCVDGEVCPRFHNSPALEAWRRILCSVGGRTPRWGSQIGSKYFIPAQDKEVIVAEPLRLTASGLMNRR